MPPRASRPIRQSDRDSGHRSSEDLVSQAGATTAIWSTQVPHYAPLRSDAVADVCIVGAGIAGLTSAYLLAREGVSVVVLDDGPIAGGMSHRTSAHLSNVLDDRYAETERLVGRDGIRLVAESHSRAIDCIEEIAAAEGIDCQFRRVDGYLFQPDPGQHDLLERELRAAHAAGLSGVERIAGAPVPFDTGPCLRFPDQAEFEPVRYLAGLACAVERLGGRIHTGTHAEAVEDGPAPRVTTSQGPVVRARAIIVATNSPVDAVVSIHTKQAPYLTYVIAIEIPPGSVPAALYWDTLDPYHYVRVHRPPEGGLEWLVVGGEDHKTGQAANQRVRFDRLERWARERFPFAASVGARWSGQVMETVDGLAFIGRHPAHRDGVYLATGDSGMGLTHGTIAGMLLTDLIQGRENPWSRIYDPSRMPLGAAREFARENLNVAVQYAQWATRGTVSSAEELAPGEAGILRRGLTPLALYRDADGTLHERSAVCPHLGCIVSWNALELTWDCPCHGSRFAADGAVVNGPANRDLSKA